MAHCIRCGGETGKGQRICYPCISKWMNMRSAVFKELEKKYGELTPLNLEIHKKEMKRFENIWRKDKDKFAIELLKINGDE